jgi:hypothetical protein
MISLNKLHTEFQRRLAANKAISTVQQVEELLMQIVCDELCGYAEDRVDVGCTEEEVNSELKQQTQAIKDWMNQELALWVGMHSAPCAAHTKH